MKPVTSERESKFYLFMPDTLGMDLAKDPAAQMLTNPITLGQKVTEFTADAQTGWRISSVEVHGNSSDEKSTSPNAGIGVSDDPEMAALAMQYGTYVKGAVVEGLAKANVAVPDNAITLTAGEVILDHEAQLHLDSLREEGGYSSIEAFIDEYKHRPENLSDEARSSLKAYLDNNRGAVVTVIQSRTDMVLEPTIATTTVTHCVDETIIDRTTELTSKEYPLKIPILPVPYFALAVRRRREDTESQIAPAEGQTAIVDQAVSAPTAQTIVTEAATGVVARQPYGATEASNSVGDGPAYQQSGRHRLELPYRTRTSFISDYSRRGIYYEEWEQFTRIRNRVFAGLAAVSLVAIGLTIKSIDLDGGYCPDTKNYKEQPVTWGNGFPDVVYGRWNNLLNGNVTELGVVAGGIACDGNNDQYGSSLVKTCDERELLYVDNRLQQVWGSEPDPRSQQKRVVTE